MEQLLAFLPNLIVVALAIAVVVWQAMARVEDVKERTESEKKRSERCEEELNELREKLHASELLNQKLLLTLAGVQITIGAGAQVGQIGAGSDITQRKAIE